MILDYEVIEWAYLEHEVWKLPKRLSKTRLTNLTAIA